MKTWTVIGMLFAGLLYSAPSFGDGCCITGVVNTGGHYQVTVKYCNGSATTTVVYSCNTSTPPYPDQSGCECPSGGDECDDFTDPHAFGCDRVISTEVAAETSTLP